MKRKRFVMIICGFVIFAAGVWAGKDDRQTVHAQNPLKVTIPQSWGRCAAAVPGASDTIHP
jgi:hypothetical protein